ncbi:MAG: hypothetical protein LBV33_03485 [Lachnospiraceae bacterium]|jgi:hypothetical protein|nr:hypothetical protein [Lachnospiraceae bacterium]
MFQILLENRLLTIFIISVLLLSIIIQIMIGVIYQRLINETEYLSTTKNKQLKLCKLKFQNCYYLNGSIANISVFVDKFIGRLTFIRITLTGLKQLSAQLVMFSVFLCGIGSCIGIIEGEEFMRVLSYYLAAFAGLYVYFSISSMVDISGRKEVLKINLMDYLENHLLSRLKNNQVENTGGYIEGQEVAEPFRGGRAGKAKRKKEDRTGGAGDLNYRNSEYLKVDRNAAAEARMRRRGAEADLATQGRGVETNQATQEERSAVYDFPVDKLVAESAATAAGKVCSDREKELKAAIAAFTEEEIEELLKEFIV